LRLRGPLPLALVPLFLTVLLVWQAVREDTYAGDGSSNWETHSSGRALLVVGVLINVGAAVTMFVLRDRGRAAWAISIPAMVIGVIAGLAGLIAISAN
jgi:hypothetical protein